jgi:hypothetical protein
MERGRLEQAAEQEPALAQRRVGDVVGPHVLDIDHRPGRRAGESGARDAHGHAPALRIEPVLLVWVAPAPRADLRQGLDVARDLLVWGDAVPVPGAALERLAGSPGEGERVIVDRQGSPAREVEDREAHDAGLEDAAQHLVGGLLPALLLPG